ncbi:MAG: ribonuclease H-like domain-containing protein [Mycolicibacter algericus]|uniref:ribonuclease H-like domain-containing protein n=1 Tax=Mycolicibacter algericus TaxID=1288388 RepID=UPI003C781E87
MAARILTFDIETQRAQVEVFNLWPKYIPIDRVLKPARVLCFSARWRGEDKDIFYAAWDDDDDGAYEKMLRAIWKLLDQADVVVTWNGDRFDLQWIEEECGRLGMGRPGPYKSVDLLKVAKRRFKAGLMSLKLEWSARQWLRDGKVDHRGTDLWHDIRHGTRAEKRAACALMREYCEHDTQLTEQIFERYLPWVSVNLALFNPPDDELLHCTKCNSTNLWRDGKRYYHTLAGLYQVWRCRDCGASSRGKRMKNTTELRPTP